MNQERLEIRDLERGEIEAILRRNQVGRVAFCIRDIVSIQPIHYVYDGDWLYGRTGPGVKLATLRHNDRIAFEVDEIDALYAWRSVVVQGTFVPVVEGEPEWSPEVWEHGVALLRRLDPSIFTPADPAPHRDVLFRIAIHEVSGRAAWPPGPTP